MPLIVDRAQIEKDIVLAFHECMTEKPITKISMREIASRAKMSHAKILYYFESKEQLLLAYVNFVTNKYVDFFHQWLIDIREKQLHYANGKECINLLLKETINLDHCTYTSPFVQIYILGQFNDDIKSKIEQTYASWRHGINNILYELYGTSMEETAEALLVLIEGLFLYTLNDTITNEHIESLIDNLSLL